LLLALPFDRAERSIEALEGCWIRLQAWRTAEIEGVHRIHRSDAFERIASNQYHPAGGITEVARVVQHTLRDNVDISAAIRSRLVADAMVPARPIEHDDLEEAMAVKLERFGRVSGAEPLRLERRTVAGLNVGQEASHGTGVICSRGAFAWLV
jgi:hypothetical protein